MKKLTLLLCVLWAGMAQAQEPAAEPVRVSRDTTYWTRAGVAGVNLSQVSLTNWSAGGDGSLAFDLMFNYTADYKKEKHLWQNRLELAYGMNNTSGNGARKTNDKIYLSSVYGYRIAQAWYVSGQLNFSTQFANGYDYSVDPRTFVSRFMAPGYLALGAGFTWTPKKWFTATLSPATWRGTFVTSDLLSAAGAFGVTPGKHLLSEFGASVRLEATYEFLPNMTVYSRVDLYSDYLRKPQNVDVRWDIQLTMKINKWFSASLNTNLVYDDDVKILTSDGHKGARVQFKEVLGVGLQARF